MSSVSTEVCAREISSRCLLRSAPDAEMVFEGVPAGPFRGLEAIAAAYAAQPPTDEVLLLGPARDEDGVTVGDYAWATEGVRAGRMLLNCPRRIDHPAGRHVRAARRVTFLNTGAGDDLHVQSGCEINQWCPNGSTTRPCRNP
jgi:hypothetical protein